MTSGYVILDLGDYTPTGLGRNVTTEQAAIIMGNIGKPILLTGVTGQPTPAYIVPTEGVDSFTFNAYGYDFTLDGVRLKATKTEYAKTTDLPSTATVTKAGLVKKSANVPAIATPASATAESNATTINAILSALKTAGIMVADN